MKRVVITGMGINSCIGNTLEEVTHHYKTGFQGHVLTQLMLNSILKAISALLLNKTLMVSTVS
jgi:3-oxoacyl-(acyl-carrier-protein) synthase